MISMIGLDLIAESQRRPQWGLAGFSQMVGNLKLEGHWHRACSLRASAVSHVHSDQCPAQGGLCQCQWRMRLPSNQHPPGNGASCACSSHWQCTLCCLGYRSLVRIAELGAVARPADMQHRSTDSDSEWRRRILVLSAKYCDVTVYRTCKTESDALVMATPRNLKSLLRARAWQWQLHQSTLAGRLPQGPVQTRSRGPTQWSIPAS